MNYYAKAITLLENPNTDFKALCYEIAKTNPSVLVKASKEPFVNNVLLIRLLNEGRKIEAIKQYRTWTGAGLRESKDYVEGLEA